jgi:hypothetical protein
VTEQGNLTNDDVDIDDVTMNEEIVTTNVTHGSHGHDDKDTSRQKKVTFDTHIVDDGNDPDAVEIGSAYGDLRQASTEWNLIDIGVDGRDAMASTSIFPASNLPWVNPQYSS